MQPVLPLATKITPGTITNSTADTSLISMTIPSNGLARAGTLVRLTAWGDLLQNSAASRTFTLKFKLSGASTSTLTTSAITVSTSTARRPWKVQTDVMAESVSSQRAFTEAAFGTDVALAIGTASQSAAQTLSAKVTGQLSAASANYNVTCRGGYLEYIRGSTVPPTGASPRGRATVTISRLKVERKLASAPSGTGSVTADLYNIAD